MERFVITLIVRGDELYKRKGSMGRDLGELGIDLQRDQVSIQRTQ